MLKNKSKIVIFIVTILLLCSTLSFATNPENANPEDLLRTPTDNITNTSADNDTTLSTEQPTTTSTEEQEIHNGDLYLFNNNIVMNKLVDGNVFLFGSNIEVNGKVNGSLYAFGNNIKFGSDSYVVQSIYAFGNTIDLNGSATDLYAFASKVNMSYDSFMIRDLKVFADTFNFNGGVGRNAFVNTNNFNFVTTDQKAGIIYGDLQYSSNNELSLSNAFVQGDISFVKNNYIAEKTTSDMILDFIIDFCNTLLYAFVVFFLCLWLAPKFLQKASNYVSVKQGFTSLGIGVLACIAIVLVSFALLFSIVGLPLAFMLLGIFFLLLSISMAVTCICITYKLRDKFNYSKNYMTYLTLAGVILAIWALKMLPYAGWIISLAVTFFGFGVILHYLFTKERINKKEDKPVKEAKKIIETTAKKETKPTTATKKVTETKTKKETTTKKETKKQDKKDDK